MFAYVGELLLLYVGYWFLILCLCDGFVFGRSCLLLGIGLIVDIDCADVLCGLWSCLLACICLLGLFDLIVLFCIWAV